MADGISLDDYVKETLLGIVRAVIAAQDDEVCGGFIGRAAHGGSINRDEARNAVTEVSFDLATSVEDKGTTGGSVGVKVIPFMKADLNGQILSSQSTVSRIAFTVPIAVPRPKAQREEDARRDEQDRAQHERDTQMINNRSSGY